MASKPTTPKPRAKPATKPVLVHDAEAVVAAEATAGESAPESAAKSGPAGLRLRELIERVTASSGVKKKEVKTVVEATLTALGAALQAGETLNLQGLGRVRVARKGPEGSGILTLKLKVPGVGGAVKEADKDTLADDEDQD